MSPLRDAACELLPIGLAVAAHVRDEPFESAFTTDHADAVQATGDLVAVPRRTCRRRGASSADRQRRQILLRHEVDRDAVTPVPNRDGMVRMEDHLDALVASREGLVDELSTTS